MSQAWRTSVESATKSGARRHPPGGDFKVTRKNYLFTSESVSEGHPDKVCDRISDAIVDAYLTADPYSRVACETLATTNQVVLAGEVRGPASVTKELMEQIARSAIRDIGYEQEGFHWQRARVDNYIHQQ